MPEWWDIAVGALLAALLAYASANLPPPGEFLQELKGGRSLQIERIRGGGA